MVLENFDIIRFYKYIDSIRFCQNWPFKKMYVTVADFFFCQPQTKYFEICHFEEMWLTLNQYNSSKANV